jgi:Ring finger domain/Zn-finger in Ran binding protein and others
LFATARFSSTPAGSSTPAVQQQRNNNNAIDLTMSPSPTRYNAIDLLSDDDEEEEDRQHDGFDELSYVSSVDDDMEIDEVEVVAASAEVEDERKLPPVAALATTTTTISSSPTNSTSTDEDAESYIEDDDDHSAGDHKVPAVASRTPFDSTSTVDNNNNNEESEEEDEDDDDEIVEYWQCPVCTLLNSSDRTICEACQSSARGTGQENHHQRHHHHRHRAATSSFASSLASSTPFHPPPFGSLLYAQAIAPTSTTGSAGMGTTGALRQQRSTIYDQHHQSALDTPEVARLDRHRQHLSALIDQQRQQLNQQRQQLDRWQQLQRQQPHQAAATAHLQRHGAAVPQHDRTLMLLATLGRSRSSVPMQRYAAMVQAARITHGAANTDGMNYEQLLQAFGDGTENMGASDHDIQQLPVSVVVDPDKDLPEDRRTCNICLEDFVAKDERRTLPCLHGYHKECSDKWLKTNASCPVCKHSIRE